MIPSTHIQMKERTNSIKLPSDVYTYEADISPSASCVHTIIIMTKNSKVVRMDCLLASSGNGN